MAKNKTKRRAGGASGRLRIGDDWNAITIIALSQSNPLKAVAEFVENSIDAGARNVTITRGRERGEHYLVVSDDGEGIPRDDEGIPNFRYVATHICDSLKRRLKSEGVAGIQGEFGIGLLSFWTVGEELSMRSAGLDGKTYEMRMRKGESGLRGGEAAGALFGYRDRAQSEAFTVRDPAVERREDSVVSRFGASRSHSSIRCSHQGGRSAGAQAVRGSTAGV